MNVEFKISHFFLYVLLLTYNNPIRKGTFLVLIRLIKKGLLEV